MAFKDLTLCSHPHIYDLNFASKLKRVDGLDGDVRRTIAAPMRQSTNKECWYGGMLHLRSDGMFKPSAFIVFRFTYCEKTQEAIRDELRRTNGNLEAAKTMMEFWSKLFLCSLNMSEHSMVMPHTLRQSKVFCMP